jgi:hypothetical protein
MAHQLSGTAILKLHQALHGYADGHRQLALSTTLKPREQRTLLALSDISGAGAKLDESGYLTGYPLPDSAVFALARTWPAPEMPRPGCVWTHTLLIDFADLAVMTSLSQLMDVFRRPMGLSDSQLYAEPTELEVTSGAEPSLKHRGWTRQMLAALYERSKKQIVVSDPGPGADLAILALWSQQWPRLRRSFRFCTFAPGDRSVEGAVFDLQVLPESDRGLRSRFANAVDAETVAIDAAPWIEAATQDLFHPDVDGLRSFLRRLGSDVASGRNAFRPLCQLHEVVKAIGYRVDAVHEAIAILQSQLGPKEARSARAAVIDAVLPRIDVLDDQSFDFVWSNLALLESDVLRANAARIGSAAWRRDPSRLAAAPIDDVLLGALVDGALDTLTPSEVAAGLRFAPTLAEKALTRRQEIVEVSDFWRHSNLIDEGLRAAKSGGRQRAAIKAIVGAGRGDLASQVSAVMGSRDILAVLKEAPDAYGADIIDWLRSATTDTNSVADFLANETGIHRAMLYELARILPPDAVPNDYGEDSWVTAWRSSVGTTDEQSATYLAAYFLARALGRRSRSQAVLAQFGFEKVHHAAGTNLLSDEAWRLVEPRLPWADFWFNWDRCQRLRAAVIELFVESELQPDIFARLVVDPELFTMLANAAARSGRGRSYLKRVERSMGNDSDAVKSDRLLTLDKILNRDW